MTLQELFSNYSDIEIIGNVNTKITGIQMDSRLVKPGDLFVAIEGKTHDGKAFVKDATQRGAKAILAERKIDVACPLVFMNHLKQRIGHVASRFYGEPSRHLKIIGVTGTNGKTTTSYLIAKALKKLDVQAVYMGTLGIECPDQDMMSLERTTLESVVLQKYYFGFLKSKITHVVMECSSHGIDQGRLNGIDFDVCVFTNLTQDHLDYHASMREYELAKEKLFSVLLKQSKKSHKYALINTDDLTASRWSRKWETIKTVDYGIKGQPTLVHVEKMNLSPQGVDATLEIENKQYAFSSKLLGSYNFQNLLAALNVLLVLDVDPKKAIDALGELNNIPGRLENVSVNEDRVVLVDYAHTDDALLNVLATLKPITKGKLWTVFGCGGNRDQTKRPKMASVACRFSDYVVITSDNPRNEEPNDIIEQIVKGVDMNFEICMNQSVRQNKQCFIIEDRKEAIRFAIDNLGSGDVLLIAGKGHEPYQEIKGQRQDFDDRVVAKEAQHAD